MARLPNPGGDSDEWGDILNSFLGVAHNDDGTLKSLDPDDVGLGNVNNTSDINKPVSSAAQTALDLKLSKTGGTMSGNLNMGGSQVTNLGVTTSDADAATKSYVDSISFESMATASGGTNMRDANLDAWYEDLENATTQSVDLVVLADSIGEFGWIDGLETQLATRYNARQDVMTQPIVGYHTAGSTSFHAMPTSTGSDSESGAAGFSSTLTDGQSSSMTVYCDGVIVLWTAGTGTLTVKDGGSGGSTVATIDTNTGTGSSNITSIDLTTHASHNIWIGSTGNTHLEGVYPTAGNRTVGVRVWRFAHAGYSTADFVDNTDYGLDFIAKLKVHTGREPHVMVATGFNDPVVSYEDDLNNLITAIKARTNGTLTRWINWGSSTGNAGGVAKHDIALDVAEQQNMAVIDAYRAFGDIGLGADANNLSPDNAHPGASGSGVIMTQALLVLGGDPLGALSGVVTSYPWNYRGTISTTHAVPTGNSLWSPTLDLGSIDTAHFFGYPMFHVKNSSGDDWGQISIVPGPAVEQLYPAFDAATIAFGPGGDGAFAPTWDTYLYRSGSGELSLRASNTTYANLVTNLTRSGAGSPETSVAAPIGATYKDTTNGTNYIKTVGTGNTGWQAAGGNRAINAQVGTSYTLLLADQGKVVTLNNGSEITLNIPTNTTAAFPVGTEIDIIQLGIGQVVVTPAGTVTVNSTPGLKISARYGRAKLLKIATNEWVLSGDLSA